MLRRNCRRLPAHLQRGLVAARRRTPPTPMPSIQSCLLFSFFCLACVLGAACNDGSGAPATPAELQRALVGADMLEVWLPEAQDEDQQGALQLLNERVVLAAKTLAERRGVEVRVLTGSASGDTRAPRIVLGTHEDPALRALLLAAGAEGLDGGQLLWNGCVLRHPGDALLACIEDPERPALPLNLFVAYELADLVAACGDLSPATRPGMRVLRKNAAVLDLPLTSGGRVRSGSRAVLDWGRWFDVGQTSGLHIRRAPGVTAELALDYVEQIDAALGVLHSWSGDSPHLDQELFLVADGETLRALAGGSGQFVQASVSGRSFALIASQLATDGGAGVARHAARAVLGEPVAEWMLDGASLDAAGVWWGTSLRAWGLRLASLELIPSSAELRHPASVDEYSQHILAPARGLLWRYLRQSEGPQAVQAVWRGERELQVDDASFQAWLVEAEGDGNSLGDPLQLRAERLAHIESQGFLRGVCFASNVRAGGGFDQPELTHSLRTARTQKVNTVSVSSFYSDRPSATRTPGRSRVHGRECLEGDAALAQLFASAREQGVEVLALRPQLILGESAGYSQWLRRTQLDEWQEFYAGYERMLTHYALLAELCGVDLLSLGSELAPQAPESASDELHDYRQQALSQLIRGLRARFDGALTYAARWPGDARLFEHWDELDYVGFSWFPRAPRQDLPPRSLLALRSDWRVQLGNMAELAASAGKPWLVLEFGVRATDGGTRHASLGFGSTNPAQQARAVQALGGALTNLAKTGTPPTGLFWWHWNASPNSPGAGPRGYSLQNQPSRTGIFRIGQGL